MALALNHKIKIDVVPFDLCFHMFSPVKTFYGSGNKFLPYQSIYYNQKAVVPGRRNDALDRLKMIPPEILSGANILDVASNYDMSSILAYKLGATQVRGLEISAQIVDLATRMAMIEGVYPNVSFDVFDVDQDKLDNLAL